MDYHLNDDFSYCVNIQDIQFINHNEHLYFTLHYPEAAIFDLIFKGYGKKSMVRMMTKIALVSETHAEDLIRDTINILIENKVIETG